MSILSSAKRLLMAGSAPTGRSMRGSGWTRSFRTSGKLKRKWTSNMGSTPMWYKELPIAPTTSVGQC